MTTPLKVTIQQGDKEPRGPYHWKHIVELYEFSLLKKYVWAKSDSVKRSIDDLVAITGVPPTISLNAILNSPATNATPASEATLNKLYALGCPRIYVTLPEDLALHLIKRLEMSDEQLDAEDPNYVVKDPFSERLPRKAQTSQGSDDGEFPSSGETEEEEEEEEEDNTVPPEEVTEDHSQNFSEVTDESDEGDKEDPVDAEETNEPLLNEVEESPDSVEHQDESVEESVEPDEQNPTALEEEHNLPIADSEEKADTSHNPFLEGDEVGDEENDEEDFEEPNERPRKIGGSIAIVIIVLLTIIAAIIYFNQTGSAEEPSEQSPEAVTDSTLE